MPPDEVRSWSRSGPGTESRGTGELNSLLRSSHVFAAAVHESIEADLERNGSPACSFEQIQLLHLIELGGARRAGDVARALGLSAPAVTKKLDRLERLELINRACAPDDRRATALSLTTRGRATLREHLQRRATRMASAVEGIPAAERRKLAKLLERVAHDLLVAAPAAGGACLRCGGYVRRRCALDGVRGRCAYPEDGTPRQRPRPGRWR